MFVVNLILIVSVFSLLAAGIFYFQDFFKVSNRQKLYFLKLNTVLIWVIPLLVGPTRSLSGVKVLGNLLPASPLLANKLLLNRTQFSVIDSDHFLFLDVMLIFYFIGVSIMVLRLVRSYLAMRRLLLSSSMIEIKNTMVRISNCISTPFSFGFLNPQIFLPRSLLSNVSENSIKIILAHEKNHIANHDCQWKLFSLLTRCFLFFSPISYYLHQKFELEIEIECDRLTINGSNTTISEYGNILIQAVAKLNELRPNEMLTYISDSNLKRRIYAMKTKTTQQPLITLFFAGLSFLGSLTAIATASDLPSLKGHFYIRADMILNGKIVSSPQFKVLPEEPALLEMISDNPKNELKIKLVASDSENAEVPEGIELQMAVHYQLQDRLFKFNPHVIVVPGEDSKFVIGTDGNSTLEMKLRAERQ
jgi:Zn-dependent protease with chaperone function